MQSNTLFHRVLKHSALVNLAYMLYRYLIVAVFRKQKVVSAEKMLSSHRKPKLMVLGCGASINDLDSDFFEQISDYDVTAFSYAALLPVDVDYYLYEIPSGTLLKHHEEILYPRLVEKKENGGLKHLLLKNPHATNNRFYELFPSVLASMTFPIHILSIKKLSFLIGFFKRAGLSKKYFFQSRASLFSTCLWADSVGYEEILLVGIDLNTAKYFYEEENKWFDFRIPNPFPDVKTMSKDVHPTNDEDLGLKVEDAMRVLGSKVKARIFVSNPHSALASIFQVKLRP